MRSYRKKRHAVLRYKAPSKILQYLKGRSTRLLQNEFPKLKRNIEGNI